MSGTFHDAQAASHQREINGLLRRSKPEERDGFQWKDPLRDFESMGQFVAVELRHWTNLREDERLAFLAARAKSQYQLEPLPGEDENQHQTRLRRAWRDLAFIIAEELKCWGVRPELLGRGSRKVIHKALTLLVPQEAEAPVERKKGK